jgi:hypothetical protein
VANSDEEGKQLDSSSLFPRLSLSFVPLSWVGNPELDPRRKQRYSGYACALDRFDSVYVRDAAFTRPVLPLTEVTKRETPSATRDLAAGDIQSAAAHRVQGLDSQAAVAPTNHSRVFGGGAGQGWREGLVSGAAETSPATPSRDHATATNVALPGGGGSLCRFK